MTQEDQKILNKALAYLGKRFDALETLLSNGNKAEIKVDVGEASELLADVSKSLDRVVAQIMVREDKEQKGFDSMVKSESQLKAIAKELTAHSSYLKDLSSREDGKNIDTIKTELRGLINAIKSLEIRAPEVQINGLQELASLLKIVVEMLSKVDLDATNMLLEKLIVATKANQIEFPSSFKLDDAQFRELRTVLADVSGGNGVSMVGGSAPAPVASIIKSGRVVVETLNEAIALGTDNCETVFITALTTNTNPVVIGDAGVVYTEADRTGKVMFPGDSITISVRSLAKLFVNGAEADGVSFTYTKL